jgi:hypothetical protein
MIGWIFAGVFAWLATAVGVLGLCRAAADADRAMHAHYPPLDDEDAWADLVARLEAPTRCCPTCGAWLPGDALFDRPECQQIWEEAT